MGIIGYHPTALPANRGRHPLIWALALGLKETASSFFFMDEGADSGDILSQEPVAISPTDDAGSLYQRITTTAMSQIRDFIPQLSEGNYTRVQQDHSQANTWRKRSIEDGKIDWRMSADSIHNLVRALTHPYVGAHFIHRERLVKVWRTEIENNISANFEPGKVLSLSDQGILVKAGTEAIWLCEIDPVTAVETGDYL
jgi:methionyl-tRNA formyltransferase